MERTPYFRDLPDPLQVRLLLAECRVLVPGVLIAALAPGAIAAFKYLTAALGARGSGAVSVPRSRGVAGALIALISLSADIATLVVFREYLFKK